MSNISDESGMSVFPEYSLEPADLSIQQDHQVQTPSKSAWSHFFLDAEAVASNYMVSKHVKHQIGHRLDHRSPCGACLGIWEVAICTAWTSPPAEASHSGRFAGLPKRLAVEAVCSGGGPTSPDSA